MRDDYAMEYTELKNAPHFIFNGKSTRDFNVRNVSVDTGALAEDMFLANRSPIIDRTRYSDKSYLLGFNEEPISFKIRLLFDERKFTMDNLRALRRWLYTETFKEFKFDNETESSINVIMYAMVNNASTINHNVINDGYVDLEFITNSSKKYSEIMTEEYDFSESTLVKTQRMFKGAYSTYLTELEGFARKLKQYIANTNYAGIEEFFKDKNKDRIPDGWKLVKGKATDITFSGSTIQLNNVRLRKHLDFINGRNYYFSVKGSGGKVRIHENDYDINSLKVHEFKYRRNILGDAGTFDIDSSQDGVGEGWEKVGDVVASIDKNSEIQTLTSGHLSISPTFLKGQKYVFIAETPKGDGAATINGKKIVANDSLLVHTFMGVTGNKILLDKGTYSHIRLFAVNDKEYKELPSLSDDKVRLLYPHSDKRNYLDLNFEGTKGAIEYIRLYELSDLDKSRIDKGAKLNDIVGIDYAAYTKMLSLHKSRLNEARLNLISTVSRLKEVDARGFNTSIAEVSSFTDKVTNFLPKLTRGNSINNFQWEDVQPEYKQMMLFVDEIKELHSKMSETLKENVGLLNNSPFAISTIQIFNFGDLEVAPTFEFTSYDAADVEIKNLNTGQICTVTDMQKNETVKLIGVSEKVTTSRPAPYFKYDSHNDEFIQLRLGHNELSFRGNIKIKITYQFILL